MAAGVARGPTHRRAHAAPVSGLPGFDLASEVERLHQEYAWSTGRNSRTLMTHDDFRVVLTALQAHARIVPNATEGRTSIHLITGHIRLHAAGQTIDLLPGRIVGLDRGRLHDIEAVEESAFLLTIAWPGP